MEDSVRISEKTTSDSVFAGAFLFMAGDLVSVKCDGPNELSGSWDRWTERFVVDRVEWSPSPVVNSSYVGLTVFAAEPFLVSDSGHRHYAKSCALEPVPATKTEQVRFMNDYYDRPANWKCAQVIREYFKVEGKRRLGRYLFDHQRWLFEYLVAGQALRRRTGEDTFSSDVFGLPGHSLRTDSQIFRFNEYSREAIARLSKLDLRRVDRVVCARGFNNEGRTKITKGATYEVLMRHGNYVVVIDDYGVPEVFLKDFFQ